MSCLPQPRGLRLGRIVALASATACVGMAVEADLCALQLTAVEEAAHVANGTEEQHTTAGLPSCFDGIRTQASEMADGGCPVKFYMFDTADPAVADCYGHYISEEELRRWREKDEDSHHSGPIFVARYLPLHRCAVQDPEEADIIVVPPFLPQWNRNFDNKDAECQKKVLHFASKSKAYLASAATGHSNFVVMNWWKGREWGTLQTTMFPNATFVGKDCKNDPCDDPFAAWPYFDNTPGTFDGGDTLPGIAGRQTLASGVWGSRRGGDAQRRPLESALREGGEDLEFRTPGALTDHGASIFDLYRRSKFCLNPRGDSLSRRSLSTCILAGSVPVILVDGLNLPFEHVLDYSKFSVRVPERVNPQEVLGMLRSMPQQQVDALQQGAACVRQAFRYDARTAQGAVAPGGLLDFLLADIAHVALRRTGWKRPA